MHTVTADDTGVWRLEGDQWDGSILEDENNDGEVLTVTVNAYDQAGNQTGPVISEAAYGEPVASGEGEILTPKTGALLTDLDPIIAGLGEANTTYYVELSDNHGEAATYQITTDANGVWTVNLDNGGDVPMSIPPPPSRSMNPKP